jgi:hypothetical protein
MQVREGKRVAVTCPKCGCRLEKQDDTHFRHFGINLMRGTDARGCRCPDFWLAGGLFQNTVMFTATTCRSC